VDSTGSDEATEAASEPATDPVSEDAAPAAEAAERAPDEESADASDADDDGAAVGGRGRHRAAGVADGAGFTLAPPPATGVKAVLLRFEMPLLILMAIVIAIVLKTFVIQPFYIPSDSMEQTLHGCSGCSGDRILVFKPVYHTRDPHPGDIVVFKAPPDWQEAGGTVPASNPIARGAQWFGQLVGIVPPSEKDLVKRVVAIGGETVKCCDDKGNVQISKNGPNGPWTSLEEPYIYQPQPYAKPGPDGQRSPNDARSFGPVTVPSGRLWVLGDHRSDSADSRYHCGDGGSGSACDALSATVPLDDVIGKAVVIAWPPSRWRTLGTPKTFKTLAEAAYPVAASPGASVAGVLGVTGLALRRRRRRSRRP
jgi:signal peptidase I